MTHQYGPRICIGEMIEDIVYRIKQSDIHGDVDDDMGVCPTAPNKLKLLFIAKEALVKYQEEVRRLYESPGKSNHGAG